MKKYEFTNETKEIDMQYGKFILHRIQAVTDFSDVKTGELGGWIEKEENLSHNGNAWVYDNAQIFGDARVRSNAKIYDNVQIYDNAVVRGNAEIYNNAQIFGDAQIYGDAQIWDNTAVYDNAKVFGNVKIYENANIYGNAKVYGNVWVYGNAVVCDNAMVYNDNNNDNNVIAHGTVTCDNAKINGIALDRDSVVRVYRDDVSNATVYGNAKVCGNAIVCGNAEVFSPNHVLIIGAIGSRNDFTTFYRGKNRLIMVKCGCFNGTLDEFLDKVEKTHGNNRHTFVYRAAAVVARLQIDLSSVAAEKTLE